ncbi:hypothetical protein DH2020_030832 [Rehmannia glutinosa]|uniref:Uncharacterized protein n=1 Tax=Rehmannia glutinosa TaxID=99300 RepID=A0ABR0VJP8_REHGL
MVIEIHNPTQNPIPTDCTAPFSYLPLSSAARDGHALHHHPLLASRPPHYQPIRVETLPNPRRLPTLRRHHRRHLPHPHTLSPQILSPPSRPLRRPPPHHRRPQPNPLPPLPPDGRRLRPLRRPPDAAAPPDLAHLLPRGPNPAARAHILLGPRLLLLENPRVRRHAPDPPERVPLPAAVVPPRVPPRGGGGDVLRVAGGVAVAVPGGARDQRDGARGDVRVLPGGGAGNPAVVEEIGDGFSDLPVRVQFPDFGLDDVPPF